MEKAELERLLKANISNIEKGNLSERVVSYTDYKTKFMFLKKSVFVTVELPSGKTAKIDISDYFKEEE